MKRLFSILFWLVLTGIADAQFVINNQATACVGASISAGPTNVTCLTNTTVSFAVTAAGTATLYYQWRTNTIDVANGADFAGATAATLWASNAPIAWSNLSVTCYVTNACGSVTSAAAVLTVTNGLGGAAQWYDAMPITETNGIVTQADATYVRGCLVSITQSGTASKLRLGLGSIPISSGFKMALYTGDGLNLLTSLTNTLEIADSGTHKEFTIPNTAVSNANFWVAWIANDNLQEYTVKTNPATGIKVFTQSYASFPQSALTNSWADQGTNAAGIYVTP